MSIIVSASEAEQNRHTLKNIFILVLCVVIAGCGGKRETTPEAAKEDSKAKALLQGVWINEEEEDVAFKAKGDSIFYPDTTSQPVRFSIVLDTLVLQGGNTVKYPIVKQSEHLFVFKNQNGETVRLVKSDNPADNALFTHERPKALNQNRLIKRDTVLVYADDRYHSYVQVNPTTYKVIKPVYNDEGVEVDNVYYDNIIHISLYKGNRSVYSHDFRKKEFAEVVPAQYLEQAIFSDMELSHIGSDGVTYRAILAIPDGTSSYVVMVNVSFDGRMTMSLK